MEIRHPTVSSLRSVLRKTRKRTMGRLSWWQNEKLKDGRQRQDRKS
jgi:hypothetical protein